MAQVQITLDGASVAMPDATAAASAFSREEALKEAIEQYSAYDRWFRAQVEEGIKAFEAGDVYSMEEVEEEAARLLDAIRQRKSQPY